MRSEISGFNVLEADMEWMYEKHGNGYYAGSLSNDRKLH